MQLINHNEKLQNDHSVESKITDTSEQSENTSEQFFKTSETSTLNPSEKIKNKSEKQITSEKTEETTQEIEKVPQTCCTCTYAEYHTTHTFICKADNHIIREPIDILLYKRADDCAKFN